MVVLPFHTDLRSATRLQQTSSFLNRVNLKPERLSTLGRPRRRVLLPPVGALKVAVDKKPAICTADELHYVDVPNSDWRLALWRYLPSAEAPERNHPLLLLSGIGTNAIGYDLSPEASFARYMAGQGYDTWTLELRGAGLSTLKMDSGEANGRSNVHHVNGNSRQFPVKSQAKEPPLRFGQLNFLDDFTNPSHDEEGKSFSAASQMRDFIGKLLNVIERAEGSSQPLFPGIQDRISSGLKDIKKQLDAVVKYDWDFETYLEEDVPAAVRWST